MARITTIRRIRSRQDALNQDTLKIISETSPLRGSGTSFLAPGTGFHIATIAGFLAGDIITGLACCQGGTGPTSITLAKLQVWDTTGAALGATADLSGSLGTNAILSGNLTAAYTVPADGGLYLGALFVGTTAPTLLRGFLGSGSANIDTAVNSGVRQQVLSSTGSKTDAGSFTPAPYANAFWFCAYGTPAS